MFEVWYCGYNIRNVDYDTIDRPDGSKEYLFLYFMSSMIIELGSERITAPAGSMIIYTPGYRQWYHAEKEFKNSFVHFTDDGGFCKNLGLPLNRLFTIPEPAEVNETLRHIEYEFFTHNEHYEEQIDAYVKTLLIQLARSLQGQKSGGIEKNTFKMFFEIRMHILSHLDYDWNTENMAELAHMSKSQFYRYYTEIFHQPPKTELIGARMEYAKYLLTNETLPVNQIARMIGYANEYHFIRTFKNHYGFSPKQYSIMEKSKNEPL